MRPREEKRIMDRTVGVDETREMRPGGEKGTDQAQKNKPPLGKATVNLARYTSLAPDRSLMSVVVPIFFALYPIHEIYYISCKGWDWPYIRIQVQMYST